MLRSKNTFMLIYYNIFFRMHVVDSLFHGRIFQNRKFYLDIK